MGPGYEDTDWRQGHLLAEVDARRLFPAQSNEAGFSVVIISHDCDLTRPPESEPDVEVIFAKSVEALDGNFTHGKNSRKLHVQATDGESVAVMELLATAKATFPKHLLLTIHPAQTTRMNREERNILREWLASRYRRSAFPNEFNRRLSTREIPKKLSKLLKPHGKSVFGLYFKVEPEIEFSSSQEHTPYDLEVFVVYNEDGSEEIFQTVTKIVSKIKKIFEDAYCDGQTEEWTMIKLSYCTDASDRALSLADLRQLSRWNADYLSLGATPQQKLPD